MLGELCAKARRDGSGRCHPLACHLLDVASVALSLWDGVLQRGLRDHMASSLGLPAQQAGRWVAFWAGLHDLGKACPPFWNRIPEGARLNWIPALPLGPAVRATRALAHRAGRLIAASDVRCRHCHHHPPTA
ncbi:MAG: CRISPR-associated endonuclease Cas3'' [Planctomycetota bacterium]